MIKMISLLWVFLLLQNIKIVNTTCQAKTDIGNFLQDSITLHFDKTRSKYNFEYPNVLYENSIPKLALTINKFEFRNLSDIQYHIVTIFNSSSIVFHLVFPTSPAIWKNFRISFWLIGNSFTNLDIGYVSFENIQKQSSKTQLHYLKDQPFISKIRGIGQAVIFTTSFLGLAAVSSQELQIKINSKIQKNPETAQSSPYYIELSAQSGKQTKIRLIRFSYILYTPSRLQNMKYQYFSLTNSLIPQLGTQLNRYRKLLPQKLIIYPVMYGLIGVKEIKKIGLQAISLDMKLQAGNVQFLEFSFVSRIQSIQTNTLIIGQDMMMACINCPESFVKYADPVAICLGKDQCSDDEVSITDKDGVYSSCRKCLGNSFVVKKGNTKYCECPKGFITQSDGTCRKMIVYKSLAQECSDPNNIRDPLTKKCICKQGYSLDQFGFCFGCQKNTSYWDLNQEKCLCLPGFQKDQSKNICIVVGQTCGMNKIYRAGKCECDQFTIKIERNKKLQCIECSTGTYKAEDKNQCAQCHPSCRECISQQFCLACTKGYYFTEFKCQARCGDGYTVASQACDDGNSFNKDGCSESCTIQQGFLCNLDAFNRSKCQKRSLDSTIKAVPSQNKSSQSQAISPAKIIQPSTQTNMTEKQNSSNSLNITYPLIKNQSNLNSSQNITSNNSISPNLNNTNNTNNTKIINTTNTTNTTNTSNITNITNVANATNPTNKTIMTNTTNTTNIINMANSTGSQIEYKVSVSKDSPIYISAGIVVELQVKPQKKRSQQQLNNMIKIIVSERRAQPARVYITQDQNRLYAIRCLMSYNNMLPVVNFNFKIYVRFDENIWKSVSLYSQVFGKLTKSLKPLDASSYLE